MQLKPVTRRTDPHTSHAAESMLNQKSRISLMQQLYTISKKQHGTISEEFANALGEPNIWRVSKRLADCEKAGLLYKGRKPDGTIETRHASNGRPQTVWYTQYNL